MDNKFGNRQLWFGVVEDRFDPLFLGRCKVRVAGLHTNNRTELPTADLPWAFPLQPITSAAMSGVGQAPVGPVEGTWVAIQFMDNEYQQPVMIGSVGGIPIEENAKAEDIEDFLFNTVKPQEKAPANAVTDSSGTPIQTGSGGYLVTESPTEEKYLGNLTKTQYDKLKATIAQRESSNNYRAINQLGYVGKYQFGAVNLIDRGYIKAGTKQKDMRIPQKPDIWTGKDGINSNEDFFKNTQVQESCMDASMKANYKATGLTLDVPAEKQAGVLTAAHLVGAGGAKRMLNGEDPKDGNGVSAKKYYDLGYNAIAGQKTNEVPSEENLEQTAADKNRETSTSKQANAQFDIKNMPVVQQQIKTRSTTDLGFTDPNKKYPKKAWLKEPDTHRLARHQSIQKTVVYKKEQERDRNIPIANASKTWEQSLIPYNAKYPYNHILESESGHTIEIDDTKGMERIHIYHASGTFIEIDSKGTITKRSKGNCVSIVEKDDKTHIEGSGVLTVDGDFAVRVGNTCQVHVLGDAQIHVVGNVKQQIDGNYDCKVGGNINMECGGSFNLKAGGVINEQAGSSMSLKAGSQIAGDAGVIHWNSGVSSSASSATPVSNFSPSLHVLHPITRQASNDFVMEDASFEDKKKYIEEKQMSNNVPEEEPVTDPKKDNTPPPEIEPYKGDCQEVAKQKPYSRQTRLSTNFTLGQLCVSPGGGSTPLPPENGQVGLSQDQIVCNLMQVCLNVLEPLKSKYPDLIVNSGFRIGSGTSQHNKGMAIDLSRRSIESSGNKKQMMQDWSIEVKNSVPFDQIILETSGGPQSAWVHVSYNSAGNRPNSDPNKMITINTATNKKTSGLGFA